MSISHRVDSPAGDPAGAGETAPGSPSAVRRSAARWADPRLWVGVVLVLASVVAGAKILESADATVSVWRVQRDLVAGSSLSADDVERTEVHFADDTARQQYLAATASLPSDARLTRDLSAGELLAVSAITTDGTAVPLQLPLGVAAAGVPAGLSSGDHVDVWAVAASDQARVKAVQVLQDVTVTAVSSAGPGGVGADREILVALPDGTDVARALEALDKTSIVLVLKGP